MFCDNCGNQCNADAKFCGGCGFRFDGVDAPQTQSAPPQPQYQQAPPPQYQQAPPAYQPQSSGGNPAFTILATVCVCAIMAAGAGGAYFLGTRTSDDSSSSSSSSSRYDQAEAVTQAPSDSTSDTTASSDTTTAESTTPTESATTTAPSTSTDTASSSASSSTTTMEIPTAPTYDTPAQSANNDYILPTSNTQYLSSSDLYGMNLDELALARNEIYARHGRQFNNEGYTAWFNSKTWYQNIYPKYTPEAFDRLNPTPLSKIELDNIQTIIARENAMKAAG